MYADQLQPLPLLVPRPHRPCSDDKTKSAYRGGRVKLYNYYVAASQVRTIIQLHNETMSTQRPTRVYANSFDYRTEYD